MRILLVVGSRLASRQTSQALEALQEGLRAGGAEVETIILSQLRILHCRDCDETGRLCGDKGRCRLDDDFNRVVDRLRSADGAAFLSPVYPAGCAPCLRAFFHRLRQLCAHPSTRGPIAGMPTVAVCIGGGGARCGERLRQLLGPCNFRLLEVLSAARQDLHLKLPALRAAGERLASPPGPRLDRSQAPSPAE